jgi:hypothetical protein
MTGVDLTRIDGVKANTIQTVITEAGLDMSRWETERHFVSWIGWSPRNDLSGGKVLNRKTRKVVSRLATALRMAATTAGQQQLSGSTVPALPHPSGCSQSHYRHGLQAGATDLPHASIWTRIGRPGNRPL